MPRPGSGSSSRSTSSHSGSTRSTSGHRIGGSSSASRPGSAFGQRNSRPSGSFASNPGNNGFSRGPQGPGFGGPRPAPRRSSNLAPFLAGMFFGSRNRRYNPTPQPGYYHEPPRRRSHYMIWAALLVIVLVLLFLLTGCSSSSNIPASTTNREKIVSNLSYNSDCIVDEEGFFENVNDTEARLKSFFDQTGVQPYIVIHSYDPSLKTDEQKAQYAQDYYEEHITNEDTFLYVYFADQDPDAVGYMQTVNGKEIGTVMDDEAVNIFWSYLDSEWASDESTDDLFVNTFNNTANRIMTRTTTSQDVWMRILLVAGIVIIGAIIIAVLMIRRKHEKERAEETQRILNTPLESSTDDDDLIHKYGG